MDYRLEQNRREAFIRWYAWSLKYDDCDPAVWCTNYLHKRYEHNDEERIWFAWLYGNTYQLPTAWVLMNEFPDYELATFDRLDWWNTNNYKRLRYQVDMKYEKGKLPEKFVSYKNTIGNKLQKDLFYNRSEWLKSRDDKGETYYTLFEDFFRNKQIDILIKSKEDLEKSLEENIQNSFSPSQNEIYIKIKITYKNVD